MKDEKNHKDIVILPYKDALLNYVIEPEDFLKWLNDLDLKDEINSCLNELFSE